MEDEVIGFLKLKKDIIKILEGMRKLNFKLRVGKN